MIPAASATPTAFGEVDFSHPDPDGGTRRQYHTANNPDFIDSFGWTMPANPYPGWKLQVYITCSSFECNVGQSRTYKVFIGGVDTGVQQATGGPTDTSGAFRTISNLSGAVTFVDNITDDETAHTGTIVFKYRYART